MTNMKKILAVGAVVLAIGATGVSAFAASIYKTPAEAAAGLTGKTTAQVIEERQDTGKTYGTIAGDAGKLEEFKAEVLQIKKDALEKRVVAGTLAREKADEIIKALEENSATCDGTGSAQIGKNYGAGFGNGNGGGKRSGNCQGTGTGMGRGQGACISQ